jgi:hypothetical protein
MVAEPSPAAVDQNFSLVLGGPLYQLLVRVGLIKPPLNRVGLRMGVIPLFAWLPLAMLALLDGRFLTGVAVPFLLDYEVQARLLLMLPLLIGAEVLIHQRTSGIVQQFLERQIIPEEDQPRYQALIASTLRLRNSVPIEVGLAVLVFGFGSFVWRAAVSLDADTWYASVTSGGKLYTPAGYWYAFVAIPLAQFILVRWYFRFFLWGRFLWRVSRLNLTLVPTHPDRACGLGFLGNAVVALAPFLAAHTILLAGFIADRILHGASKLPEFQGEIAAMAGFLLLVALGPLCVFAPRLSQARLAGLRRYGTLASAYVIHFDRKWIGRRSQTEEALLGTADIQSLADLANSFEIVQNVRIFPFDRRTLLQLAIIIALPILPLTLTMFPLDEIVRRLLKVVF